LFHVEPLGRARYRALLGDRHEIAQMPELHGASPE
jgi:hypothetical protein